MKLILRALETGAPDNEIFFDYPEPHAQVFQERNEAVEPGIARRPEHPVERHATDTDLLGDVTDASGLRDQQKPSPELGQLGSVVPFQAVLQKQRADGRLGKALKEPSLWVGPRSSFSLNQDAVGLTRYALVRRGPSSTRHECYL